MLLKLLSQTDLGCASWVYRLTILCNTENTVIADRRRVNVDFAPSLLALCGVFDEIPVFID